MTSYIVFKLLFNKQNKTVNLDEKRSKSFSKDKQKS